MSGTQTFANYDRLLDGALRERIAAGREAGLSFERIARDLAGAGLEVSAETVRRWATDLDLGAAS